MKTTLLSLSLVAALCMGSSASAAVFVHAGPVRVGVGRPAARRVWYHRPAYVRPAVVRPVAPIYRPVITPASVVAPTPILSSTARRTAREIRAQRLRNAIHQETQEAVADALNELLNASQK